MTAQVSATIKGLLDMEKREGRGQTVVAVFGGPFGVDAFPPRSKDPLGSPTRARAKGHGEPYDEHFRRYRVPGGGGRFGILTRAGLRVYDADGFCGFGLSKPVVAIKAGEGGEGASLEAIVEYLDPEQTFFESHLTFEVLVPRRADAAPPAEKEVVVGQEAGVAVGENFLFVPRPAQPPPPPGAAPEPEPANLRFARVFAAMFERVDFEKPYADRAPYVTELAHRYYQHWENNHKSKEDKGAFIALVDREKAQLARRVAAWLALVVPY